MKFIAGIGSRETPPNILEEMKKIGQHCQKIKVVIRSGHADGADWAFEQGAQDFCIAYIPWKDFNTHLQSKARLWVPTFSDELMKTVSRFHPAPEKLTYGVQRIMARNACQILGRDLKEPSECVVCWTPDGKDSGGTGQALRIAEHHKIPILNMYHEEWNTAAKVIDYLDKNVKTKYKPRR